MTVQVRLYCKDGLVPVAEDGYICLRFRVDDTVQMHATIATDSGLKLCHHVPSGDGKLILQDMPYSEKDGEKTYEVKFTVKMTGSGALRAIIRYGKNHVVVAHQESAEVGKLGIVSQSGKMYLLAQKFPQPADCEGAKSYGENVGRVKWFDPFSGVGCLATKDGDVRVYWERFTPSADTLFELRPGEWVIFQDLQEPDSLHTTFLLEVSGLAMRLTEKPSEEVVQEFLRRTEAVARQVTTSWATFRDKYQL